MTAVHTLNTDVMPTLEAQEARIEVVVFGHRRAFCGRPDHHSYEPFLHLEEIEHRTTKVGRPQFNGIVERLHRTLLD
jgi:transposase InsO family protein